MYVFFFGVLTAYSLNWAYRALRERIGLPADTVIFYLRGLVLFDTSSALPELEKVEGGVGRILPCA